MSGVVHRDITGAAIGHCPCLRCEAGIAQFDAIGQWPDH